MSQHPRSVHLATLAHGGLLWDAYLELDEASSSREVSRACLRFTSPEAAQLYRTASIIIEHSWEDAVRRAQGLDERQLTGLLRSVLPESEEAEKSEESQDGS